MIRLSLLSLVLLLVGCGGIRPVPAEVTASVVASPRVVYPEVVAEYPHDSQAYTQGLLWYDGVLYESTGEYGQSSLRAVNPQTGRVARQVNLPDRFFGEGLALMGDSLLYQLTWQEGRCLVYRLTDFQQVGVFAYAGEGWGLEAAGDSLYMSDGSSWIRVLNPRDFTVYRRFQVRDSLNEVSNINELEWIDGRLWANIYLTDRIAVINPTNGWVTHYIDCSILETRIGHRPETDVLNGIALGPDGKIWVTGKNWNKLFEIKVDLR